LNYDLIIFEQADNVAKIILNNGDYNVMNIQMMEEIKDAIERVAKDTSLKALIFDHNGKSFSVGVDVGDHMGDKAPKMLKIFHDIFRNLLKLKCLTIACVKGAALGGGCEVAMFCDIVLTSDKAKFGQPEIKVGVFPPIAMLVLPQLIGNKKAFELLLLGEIINAEDALKLGLSNQLFPHDTYKQEFTKFIESLNNLSTVVMQYSKKAFYEGLGIDFETQLSQIEEFYLKDLMSTHDANEGLQAFMEKRPPNWQNR